MTWLLSARCQLAEDWLLDLHFDPAGWEDWPSGAHPPAWAMTLRGLDEARGRGRRFV